MKYFAKIPLTFVDEDNINWLVIEPHIHNNIIVGYYLFFHEEISESCKYDQWFDTLDKAFNTAEDYGVNKKDWEVLHEN